VSSWYFSVTSGVPVLETGRPPSDHRGL